MKKLKKKALGENKKLKKLSTKNMNIIRGGEYDPWTQGELSIIED